VEQTLTMNPEPSLLDLMTKPGPESPAAPDEPGSDDPPMSRLDPRRVEAEVEARVRAVEAAFADRLTEQARRAAELERACKEAMLERDLAASLSGRALVPGAVAQVVRLWRDEFHLVDQDGTRRVVASDGRALPMVVAERLASAEYAHFCQPTSRGGSAQTGGNRPAPAGPDPAPAPPRNRGEQALRRWLDAAPRPGDVSGPIGLSHRRRPG
jgi:hypothetical protein